MFPSLNGSVDPGDIDSLSFQCLTPESCSVEKVEKIIDSMPVYSIVKEKPMKLTFGKFVSMNTSYVK